MMFRGPYMIKHVQVNEDIALCNADHGYYLVFWDQNIPLGDLYVEKGENISAAELREKKQNAIRPAREWYNSRKANISGEESNHLSVSVVICTRNRSVPLQRCLDSIAHQTKKPLEV